MNDLLLLSKAMSDENRLKIITLIQREQQLCVCEICDTLELSQPLVSRHLKQLKAANVLESKKERKWAIYHITTSPSPLLDAYLRALRLEEQALNPVVTCKTR